MDPATIQLIQTVVTDAIKILGPALIAALATYKATQRQFELKLSELEMKHEYGARQHLFRYYQYRQADLAKHNERLNASLGEVLGYATGRYHGEDEDRDGFFATMTEFVGMYSKLAPTEIETTLRDMERNDLQDTDDYERLVEQRGLMNNLDTNPTLEVLRKSIFAIMQVYNVVQHCNQMMLQARTEAMLLKYTNR